MRLITAVFAFAAVMASLLTSTASAAPDKDPLAAPVTSTAWGPTSYLARLAPSPIGEILATQGSGDAMMDAAGQPVSGLPSGGDTGEVGSGTISSSLVPVGVTTRKVCRQTSAGLVCSTYVGPRLVKRCVTRNGVTRCQRFRSLALNSQLKWLGFPKNIIPGVGLLVSHYAGGKVGVCTASVLTRVMLITAGHCVFNPEFQAWPESVDFVPEMTWDNPGDKASIQIPHGVWRADTNGWWVPQGFVDGDFGYDYALVRISGANSAGKTIGDVEGTWSATWNITYEKGAHLYVVGYPQAGFWSTNAGYNGRGQYACDTTYEGEYSQQQSGYQLWLTCPMNQGASGGPWFVQLNDGSWTIGSVSSMCDGGGRNASGLPCQPYGVNMRGIYFNEEFGTFWHSVVG